MRQNLVGPPPTTRPLCRWLPMSSPCRVRPPDGRRRPADVGLHRRQRPVHLDIGEHERLWVPAAGEADASGLADGAVHAVAAEDAWGLGQVLFPVQTGDGDGGVLLGGRDGGRPVRPKLWSAEFAEPVVRIASVCDCGGISAKGIGSVAG